MTAEEIVGQGVNLDLAIQIYGDKLDLNTLSSLSDDGELVCFLHKLTDQQYKLVSEEDLRSFVRRISKRTESKELRLAERISANKVLERLEIFELKRRENCKTAA